MKKITSFASLKSLKKRVGSGVGSVSISQRYGSAPKCHGSPTLEIMCTFLDSKGEACFPGYNNACISWSLISLDQILEKLRIKNCSCSCFYLSKKIVVHKRKLKLSWYNSAHPTFYDGDHIKYKKELLPRGLAVANAAKLFQLLQDLVLAGEGGGGVEGELLQVVGDPTLERHLVPTHQQQSSDQQ